MKKFIYYLPRVLAIMTFAFFAIFILEGFSPDFGWQDSLSHALVALLVLISTVVAWKWPKIGGWIFVLFGLKFASAIFSQEWLSGLVIGGVPLLTGTLFLVEGYRKKSMSN